MAGVTLPRDGGWGRSGRTDLGPGLHAALPRWLARADGEGRALAELVSIASEATTATEVDAAVRALRVAVPVHIAAEERAGGMFTMAVAVAPDHAATLRRLLDAHDALLNQLAGLGDARACRREALRAFCAALLDHERTESDLLAAIADRVTSPVA